MEDAGGQFGPIPEANPMTKATANDVVQSKKASGPAGSSSLWRKRRLEIIELITSQEDANNQLSTGMSVFMERMSTMKKVCLPDTSKTYLLS
jgi:hypothetical protein